ncbi:MAG: protein kinase [Byssovorax sp.]
MMLRDAPAFVHARYEPGPELGRGAQGVVLRVRDREAPRRSLVAKLWLDGAFREQALLGEFALLARARIGGLVRAHDLGRCARSGAPFLIEDFIDGPDAQAYVASAPAAERSARLHHLLTDLAGTLALLHDAGFAHGDLKPAHVRMIERTNEHDGEAHPVLLDLGAAVGRARDPSGQTAISGMTAAFAAPEQRSGALASPLADLYSLGALAWAVATGAPPPRGARPPLRDRAPWVPPSIARAIDALLREHPRDRPPDARALLRELGAARKIERLAPGHPPPPIGRERELRMLLAPGRAAVRYLVGPSGMGKSHLAQELCTRALLEGRSARLLRFPLDGGEPIARLVAFLRGQGFALPFSEAAGEGPLLLVLDELDRAPAELAAALEAYRCRGAGSGVEIVATARSAPFGAEAIALGPLDDASFEALCRALSLDDPARIAEQRIASGSNPGWLVAALGRVPLTRDTAMERLGGLSPGASALLGAIALGGGELPDALCRRFVLDRDPSSTVDRTVDDLLGELGAAALLDRRASPSGLWHALGAPALAADLAAALGSTAIADRLGRALLADPSPPVPALLALALASPPPAARRALLARAEARARSEGLRAREIEALQALAADPDGRTPARLARLERLCRDAGVSALHPQVLDWLDEAAAAHPEIRPLALRRRAEARARAGTPRARRRSPPRPGAPPPRSAIRWARRSRSARPASPPSTARPTSRPIARSARRGPGSRRSAAATPRSSAASTTTSA